MCCLIHLTRLVVQEARPFRAATVINIMLFFHILIWSHMSLTLHVNFHTRIKAPPPPARQLARTRTSTGGFGHCAVAIRRSGFLFLTTWRSTFFSFSSHSSDFFFAWSSSSYALILNTWSGSRWSMIESDRALFFLKSPKAKASIVTVHMHFGPVEFVRSVLSLGNALHLFRRLEAKTFSSSLEAQLVKLESGPKKTWSCKPCPVAGCIELNQCRCVFKFIWAPMPWSVNIVNHHLRWTHLDILDSLTVVLHTFFLFFSNLE